MNPLFWILIAIAAFILWLSITFLFIPIGGILVYKIKKLNKVFTQEFDENGNKIKKQEEKKENK